MPGKKQNRQLFTNPVRSGSGEDADTAKRLLPEIYCVPSTVANRYGKLKERAGEGFDLSKMSYEDMSETLFDLEQLSLYVRQRMLDEYDKMPYASEHKPAPVSKTDVADKCGIVELSFKDNLLKISCPVTLLRTAQESWYLSQMIEAAFRDYETRHKTKIQMEAPLFIVIRRKAHKWNSLYRDNENLETSKIINTLSSLLHITDRADTLQYLSMFEYCREGEEGTEIYLFPAADVDRHWELFRLNS